MSKLSEIVKSTTKYESAKGILETLERATLKEVADDLGIYCQTRLTKSEMQDRILCRLFGSQIPHELIGATTGLQAIRIAQANHKDRQQHRILS